MLKVTIAGQTVDAWTAPELTPTFTWTQRITSQTVSSPTLADGGFGLMSTASVSFDNVTVAIDANDDDVIDSGEEIYDEDFAATGASPTYDNELRRVEKTVHLTGPGCGIIGWVSPPTDLVETWPCVSHLSVEMC